VDLYTLLAFPANGGGLSVLDGHVFVDFGQMPTDKFEQMLRSLRLPLWLSGNKIWFVRMDGSDANDGSADDAAHAFRTIQGAVNYISANYNIANYIGTISVGPGSFETFTLVGYQRTTGYMVINGSGNATTTVVGTDIYCLGNSQVNAGVWNIRNMTLDLIVASNIGVSQNCLRADNGVQINTRNVTFRAAEQVGGLTQVHSLIRADGSGLVYIGEGCTLNSQGYAAENTRIRPLYAVSGGYLRIDADLAIAGVGEVCAYCDTRSTISRYNASPLPVISGSFSGKRYQVNDFGTIETRGGGASYFPGSADGTKTSLASYS
jgi:hypothetical protein